MAQLKGIQYGLTLAVLSLGCVAAELAAAPVIGVASTRGTMQIDDVTVRGTANVKDGSSVRTSGTSGQVRLQNGVQASFDRGTSAAVYNGRIEFYNGAGQITAQNGFYVDALGFRVSPAGTKAVARIAHQPNGRILITTVEGAVEVTRGGALLARLDPGKTYFFEPDATDAGVDLPESASRAARKPGAKLGGSGKAGMTTGAKWGLAGGIAAAGTSAGVGVALAGDDVSR